jgi:hypothetical protein
MRGVSALLLCVIALDGILGTAAQKFINAGADTPYTDSSGQVWEPDTGYFNTGSSYAVGDGSIYQSERYDPGGPPDMIYSIELDPGVYNIRLHFAEIYDGAFFDGARVFSVEMEGEEVITSLDVYQEAGDANTAHIESIDSFVVDDGELNIRFVRNVQNPKVRNARCGHC